MANPFKRRVRLAYVVSHPIQYQAPLLRAIAADPDIDLMVFFGTDFSVRGYQDEGFKVQIKWDIPLLSGYSYEFLPKLRDKDDEGFLTPLNHGLYKRLAEPEGRPSFDLVWIHGYASALQLYAIACAKAAGIPVVSRSDSRVDGPPRSQLKWRTKRFIFGMLGRVLDGMLTVGKLNDDYVRLYMGDRLPRFLMPYAVDNDWFQQQAALAVVTRSDLQRELGLDPTRPVILLAAKFQGRKRVTDLISAYARLSPAPGQEPHPYLLLVGDGELRADLEQQAAATGLKSILFCGFKNQSELPRYFDLATVFVSTSMWEPFGLVINEVMNASRAVIVSDETGCHPDLITQGVEGIIYKTKDIDALTNALRTVLETPGLAEQMGRAGLLRVSHASFAKDIEVLKTVFATLCPNTLAAPERA